MFTAPAPLAFAAPSAVSDRHRPNLFSRANGRRYGAVTIL